MIHTPGVTVELGRTGLSVSRLALGTAPLASAFWGNDEATAIATARRAIDAGIVLFDTAPLYGHGEAEARLGAALEGRRDGVVLATKAGRVLVRTAPGETEARFDFGYDATIWSLEASLRRLGTDRVDIVHIHDPDDHLDAAVAGTYRALAAMRDAGTVSAISVGTNSVATAAALVERCDLDIVMVAGRYTLLDQGAARFIDRCAARGVAYLAAGVFNSGILARPVAGSWYDYSPAPGEVLRRATVIGDICARHGVPLRTAALQFPLRRAGVASVVVGMASPAEVDENLEAVATDVPAALWEDLDPVTRQQAPAG